MFKRVTAIVFGGLGGFKLEREGHMRRFVMASVIVAGSGLIGASGASAVPAVGSAIAQLGQTNPEVIQVLDNCGRGWHRSGYGTCRPGCGAGWYQPYPGAHCRRY
jgi:hypothetical protein